MHPQNDVVQESYFGLGMFECPSVKQIETIFALSEHFKNDGLPMYTRKQWRSEVETGQEYSNYTKALHKRVAAAYKEHKANDYQEIYWPFWSTFYKFPLRELNILARLAIYDAWKAKGLDMDGHSKDHTDIINGYTFPTYDPFIEEVA